MKISELNCHCGDCKLIDYCNSYEDTPPCEQGRFENLEVQDFLNVVDYMENRSIYDEI